jgi:hypothetical protein
MYSSHNNNINIEGADSGCPLATQQHSEANTMNPALKELTCDLL